MNRPSMLVMIRFVLLTTLVVGVLLSWADRRVEAYKYADPNTDTDPDTDGGHESVYV